MAVNGRGLTAIALADTDYAITTDQVVCQQVVFWAPLDQNGPTNVGLVSVYNDRSELLGQIPTDGRVVIRVNNAKMLRVQSSQAGDSIYWRAES